VWRDWALLGVAVAASLIEAVRRPDRPAFGLPPVTTWLLAALVVSNVLAGSTLWRRTHPLAAVAFGTLIVWDVARIVAANGAIGRSSIAVVLVLPNALLRWGQGREAVIGLGIIMVWLGTTNVADPAELPDVIAGYGFFLFSAALGTSTRFHASSRLREIEQAKLHQRHELARDLHDTIGHHMSGILIEAQVGQALAASGPDRSLAVLRAIEQAATRALAEMRTIVGVLRVGAEPDLPARRAGSRPWLGRAGDIPDMGSPGFVARRTPSSRTVRRTCSASPVTSIRTRVTLRAWRLALVRASWAIR
jgi:signal transduction histidine kinase